MLSSVLYFHKPASSESTFLVTSSKVKICDAQNNRFPAFIHCNFNCTFGGGGVINTFAQKSAFQSSIFKENTITFYSLQRLGRP